MVNEIQGHKVNEGQIWICLSGFFLLELANKFHNGKYFWFAFLYFMDQVNKGQILNFCRHFFMENSWRTSKYLDLLDSQNESVIQTLLRWMGHKLKNGENLDSSWKESNK